MNARFKRRVVVFISAIGLVPQFAIGQVGKPASPAEWEKTVELAKKEGKVVVSLPASTELRAAIERSFEKRYGIDVEPLVGRASAVVRKMVDESKAGVRYVDVHMGGSESVITGMLPEGILEPIEPLMLLPEVKDPKQWWAGHVWVDNAKRFVYSTLAYQTENLWINSQMMKADEVRSFDDLLDERLKDRIGMLDPRTAGSGASTWSYLREIKGEDYLKRLVGHNYVELAKGKPIVLRGLGNYGAEWNKISTTVRDILVYSIPIYQQQFGNALKGAAFVFDLGNLCIAHLGDLSHKLTEEQIKAFGKVDIAMIPIGGTFTMPPDTAREVLQQLKPKIAIPMHYRESTYLLDMFVKGYPNKYLNTHMMTFSKMALPPPTQIMVFTPWAMRDYR